MRILRADEVVAKTGLSLTTLRRLEGKGRFPKRVPLSCRAVGWRESEVLDWVNARLGGGRDSRPVDGPGGYAA